MAIINNNQQHQIQTNIATMLVINKVAINNHLVLLLLLLLSKVKVKVNNMATMVVVNNKTTLQSLGIKIHLRLVVVAAGIVVAAAIVVVIVAVVTVVVEVGITHQIRGGY